MAISAWLRRSAIGISSGLLPFCISLELVAQAPDGVGVPQGRPTPEAQADSETAEGEAEPERFAIPVQIIEEPEDPDEAERREEKERRAEEREQADLEAQRSMAQSAGAMLDPAWWQVWIAGVGAILLSLSLIASSIAASAAAKAATVAQDVLKAERAWITFDSFDIGQVVDTTIDETYYKRAFEIRLIWKNTGRSPAINISITNMFEIIEPYDEIPTFIISDEHKPATYASIGVGDRGSNGCLLNDQQTEDWSNSETHLIIYSKVEYRDVFYPSSPKRISEICLRAAHGGGTRIIGGREVPPVIAAPVGTQNQIT